MPGPVVRFAVLLSAGLVLGPNAPSQPQAPQGNPAQVAGTHKRPSRKAARELAYDYSDWLNNEVPYIITPNELKAFLELGTNEEREQFIEHFWNLRNPNPDLSENSFKEEHYRRIAYAN
ncbi:MAG TPA: GWxTD domain-containing protein, partial [Dongiaceae bacterium]|nr:GWxTD domain-containing protein [Dongiaceae bacterium]